MSRDRRVILVGPGPWGKGTHRSVALKGEELEAWKAQRVADAQACIAERAAVDEDERRLIEVGQPSVLEASTIFLRLAGLQAKAMDVMTRQPFKLEPVDER